MLNVLLAAPLWLLKMENFFCLLHFQTSVFCIDLVANNLFKTEYQFETPCTFLGVSAKFV